MRTAWCLGLSAWTRLFISIPGSHTTCILQRFVTFAHPFYTAPGRELEGWDWEVGGTGKGGGKWGRREEGVGAGGERIVVYDLL